MAKHVCPIRHRSFDSFILVCSMFAHWIQSMFWSCTLCVSAFTTIFCQVMAPADIPARNAFQGQGTLFFPLCRVAAKSWAQLVFCEEALRTCCAFLGESHVPGETYHSEAFYTVSAETVHLQHIFCVLNTCVRRRIWVASSLAPSLFYLLKWFNATTLKVRSFSFLHTKPDQLHVTCGVKVSK